MNWLGIGMSALLGAVVFGGVRAGVEYIDARSERKTPPAPVPVPEPKKKEEPAS